MNEAELHYFNQFEEVEIRDTYTIASMEQARKLETFMNAKPLEELTDLEQLELKMYADEYIADMNKACPYRGDQVMVNGDVVIGSYDEFEKQYSVQPATHVNELVTAKGYYVMLKQDEEERFRYVVGHHFLTEVLEPREIGVPLVDVVPRLYSFAPVGSVDIVADVLEQRQASVLSQMIPDVIERVNDKISQAKNKTDALRQLRHVVVGDAHNIPEEIINDLLNYTYDLLELDESVPYVVRLQGVVCQGELLKDDSVAFEYYDKTSDELLVSPIELHLAPYPTKKDDNYEFDAYAHFAIKLKVYGDVNGINERTILVPVRNIKRMLSLRELVSVRRLTQKGE
jgi:hypothetical protein